MSPPRPSVPECDIRKMGDTCSYSIDKDGRIAGVSDNWQMFAGENQGAPSLFPATIVGTSLWDHIHDPETRYLYDTILRKLREQNRAASFHFRCDSPELRRFLRLTITPGTDGSFGFTSMLLRTEARLPVALLRNDVARDDTVVTICSMCKKMAITDDVWVEIEQGVEALRLFEREAMPLLSHGVCPSCYQRVMAELDQPL